MFAASVEPGRITLVLSIGEVRLLNNALNEVVNVVEIPTTAFATRLGGTQPRWFSPRSVSSPPDGR